eukprot:1583794-Amphidinium_carterae.1
MNGFTGGHPPIDAQCKLEAYLGFIGYIGNARLLNSRHGWTCRLGNWYVAVLDETAQLVVVRLCKPSLS